MPDSTTLSWEQRLGDRVDLLRCVRCGDTLRVEHVLQTGADRQAEGMLECRGCGNRYPVSRGTVRMVSDEGADPGAVEDVKLRTAESFAYEWERFGDFRAEWARNFADYLRPLRPEDLAGKRVLDVGS